MYRQAAKALFGLPTARLCTQTAKLRSLLPSTYFASKTRCATPCGQASSFRIACAARQYDTQANSQVQANLRQAVELGVQLPELCSGCGVKLQAENPEAPGCVDELISTQST